MTIDQISFFGPNMKSSPPSSLPGLYLMVVSSPPQVNYVATYPMPTFSDSVVVRHVLGSLDLDF